MLNSSFFDHDACAVAQALLGKVIRRHIEGVWLSARIIETEAYYLTDKGSHASLGYTAKRSALFMPAGTIYMYYARGRDSLNVSARGAGNAVLIKAAYPHFDALSPATTLTIMQNQYPLDKTGHPRPLEKLCAGQTLLCQALQLKVPDWDGKQFDEAQFYFEDVGLRVPRIIQTQRLGIPLHRDPHLPYRFVDYAFAAFCSSNPLSKSSPKQKSVNLINQT